MLNRRGEKKHPCLSPDFGERTFSIQSVAINDVRCGVFVDVLYIMLRSFPFIPSLLAIFIMKGC